MPNVLARKGLRLLDALPTAHLIRYRTTSGASLARLCIVAAECGYLEVVERLLTANADVNAAPGYDGGRTALQAAAGGGHLEMLWRLLTANADVNAVPAQYSGPTALQAAVEGGHMEVVERLKDAVAHR